MNSESSPAVVNIAAYRFAALAEPGALRTTLQVRCRALGLKGTILLSTEGINLFVAGDAAAVESLLAELRAIPGLGDLAAKYSLTAAQPFRRMLVRVKKEIIAFGVPGIEPARHTSPRIAPRELQRWLDEGRTFTLLDTRNDYEVKLGTFRGARAIGVDHFRDFPDAVACLPDALKGQPVVTFCTGGIRCEKAAPYLETQGFGEVYQLDGGILRYFEECGGAHYEGDCFVFDRRVGLDPELQETSATQCFRCLAPLTEVEQADPRYEHGRSCPYCHQSGADRMRESLARRRASLRTLASPLPGSLPADNDKPICVPLELDGATLREAFCHAVRHLPPAYWDGEARLGRVLDARREPVALDHRVRAGERYLHRIPLEVEPDVSFDLDLLHEDESLVVLSKPAPLPMHPAGRFRRNTLQHLLELLYAPQKPRPAHRLDANTTGLVVVARTRHVAGLLQPRFAAGEVRKTYLVRVWGHPPDDVFDCDAPVGVEKGAFGIRGIDAAGQAARTAFRVLARHADGSSLLEARPHTGRTNQIRLHCAHLGWPVCGDPAYPGATAAPTGQTLATDAPAVCLHAWRVAFRHPVQDQPLEFEAPPPAWASTADDSR